MSYYIIDRDSGNTVESFDNEKEARDYFEDEYQVGDKWALVRFGINSTDNELILTKP